ncbi:MAG TPA: SDR family NAD(P)-dependent oxidoreductase [Caulobacteraceae bacterium]|jgi:nucleoside-diphosphate-sugar epimerase
MAGERVAALTGASGFLGARLARAMRAAGWRIRVLVRRPADAEAMTIAGLETVLGDLADLAALKRLTEDVAVTINCAGLIKAAGREAFMAVNRDGAARLAQVAPGRVILVSSLAARSPELSDYAASKRAGEETSRAAAGERLAVVRPPVIYGPGDRETLALFRLAARSPLAPIPAGGALAIAHADDVAAAIVDLAQRPNLNGVYAVGGARPAGYAWPEIMRAAWAAVGRTPRLTPVPAWAVSLAAGASEVAGFLTRTVPIFTRGKAREMLHLDWAVRPDELAPGAPEARFTLDEGFADTIAWYRAAGWLPGATRLSVGTG